MSPNRLDLKTNKNQNSYLAVKYSLFNTYMATLALSSYPNVQSNNRLSSLHGLTTKRGKRKLNTQRWVWLVGPVWSLWSSWFDSLATAFAHRGVCIPYGPYELELISRSLSWLTLGETYYTLNPSLCSLSQAGSPRSSKLVASPLMSAKTFAIVAGTPRSFYTYGIPTFSMSGSNVRHRLGWAVLPGATSNKSLSRFVFMAALVAYSTSKWQA